MTVRRLGLIGGVLALIGVVAAAILVSVFREDEQRIIVGSEEFVAHSLEELAGASDAVIEATVVEVGPGRTIDLGGESTVELERATLQVDRVLQGSVVSDPVLVEEYYNTLQWPWKEGASGIFFLHLKDQPLKEPIYRLTSTQGRFDMDGSRVVASNDAMDWVKVLEALRPVEFEALVENTVESPTAGPTTNG